MLCRRQGARYGRRRSLVAVALAAAGLAGACGKRGSPLPPFRKNPEPIARLELAQRGDAYELAFVAPTRTIDGQQLPVLDVELLVSSEVGALDDLAEPVRLKAAPGERITHSGPLPEPGTPLRFAVRTRADGRPSPLSPESLLVVKPPPPPPSDVRVRATPEGLSLTWTECVPTTPEPVIPAGESSSGESGEQAGEDPDAAGPSAETTAPEPGESPPDPVEPARERAPRPLPPVEPGPVEEPEAVEEDVPDPPDADPAGSDDSAETETGDQAETGYETSEATVEPTPTPAPTPQPAPSTGVRLYRRTAEGDDLEPLVATALATEAHLDTDVEHGEEQCYRLRTELRGEPRVEGAPSVEVCATFVDLVPPPPPGGLSVLRLEAAVELAWSPLPEDAEVPAAIHVYRAAGDGTLEKLADLEGDATRWTDPAAPDDVVLEYALSASDEHDNESAPSDRARLIPR